MHMRVHNLQLHCFFLVWMTSQRPHQYGYARTRMRVVDILELSLDPSLFPHVKEKDLAKVTFENAISHA